VGTDLKILVLEDFVYLDSGWNHRKVAEPSSFTRLGTDTRAKRPLVVELPRKVNKRWKTSSPETGCKRPAIVVIDRSLRLQKPKRTTSATARSIGSPRPNTTPGSRRSSPTEEGWKAPGSKVKKARIRIAPKKYGSGRK